MSWSSLTTPEAFRTPAFIALVAVLCVAVVLLLHHCALVMCCDDRRRRRQHHHRAGAADQHHHQRRRREEEDDQEEEEGVSVEVVSATSTTHLVQAAAAVVVCRYRKAEQWKESTCPVCLADFDDGEPVRVLPECMHYYHAECIDTWLRGSNSCPMCRAETTPTPTPTPTPSPPGGDGDRTGTRLNNKGGGSKHGAALQRRRRQPAADMEVPQQAPPLPPAVRADDHRVSEEQERQRECSVCLSEMMADGGEAALRVVRPCGHRFHAACVDQWLRRRGTWPMCRAPSVARRRRSSLCDSAAGSLRLLQSFPRRRRRYPSLRLLPPTPPRTPPNSGHECPGLLTNTAAACGCPDLRLLAALWVPLILPPPPTPQPWGAQPLLAPLTPLPRLRSPPHLARSICGRRPTWIIWVSSRTGPSPRPKCNCLCLWFYWKRPSHPIPPLYVAGGAAVVILAFITLLVTVLRYCARSLKRAQEADAADRRRRRDSAAGGDTDDGRGVALPPPRLQQPPAPATVAVEMVRSMGPLVCTYRRADGWPEAACAVCLAELDDGVSVRVLPVCMHYFHAGCVGEWLRAHHTCPLCRAPLEPPDAATPIFFVTLPFSSRGAVFLAPPRTVFTLMPPPCATLSGLCPASSSSRRWLFLAPPAPPHHVTSSSCCRLFLVPPPPPRPIDALLLDCTPWQRGSLYVAPWHAPQLLIVRGRRRGSSRRHSLRRHGGRRFSSRLLIPAPFYSQRETEDDGGHPHPLDLSGQNRPMMATSYNPNSSPSLDEDLSRHFTVVILVTAAVVFLLLHACRYCLNRLNKEGIRRSPSSSGGGGTTVGPRQQQQPPAPAPTAPARLTTVEMAMRRSAEPIVCTYRKADGWSEATCAVCLAELADGVTVRVLPVCMHYFHASCIGEWLLAHHTCPLCRAPLHPPVAAALEFPVYDSTSDPLPWLNRCEAFFWVQQTPDDQRVGYASLHMSDAAQLWFTRLERNSGTPSWKRFVKLVNRRFGPPMTDSPLGELSLSPPSYGYGGRIHRSIPRLGMPRCGPVRATASTAISGGFAKPPETRCQPPQTKVTR
ncbi:hypothetical protein U9M48_000334 [Paspalum notatum var. saurae]|uniref:RING-type domain-containing protein n=1 Tax=Paspalum notatum var. saurae TaxID=547442 RepID=A0AAQ3SI16_PASNO